MLEFTLVTKENREYFQPFIPKSKPGERILQTKLFMIGALLDKTACGIAVCGLDDDIVQILWIYVAPSYRDRGICSALIDHVIGKSADMGVKSAFAFYRASLNDSYFMDRAFLNNSFEINTTKSYQYVLSMEEMLKRPRFKDTVLQKSDRYSSNCVLLKSLPSYKLLNTGLEKWYDLKEYMNDFSIAYEESGRIKGLLLVRQFDSLHYNLELLQTFVYSPGAVLGLIKTACISLVRSVKAGRIPPDAVFTFQNAGEKGRAFAKRVFLMSPTETVWFHIMTKDI